MQYGTSSAAAWDDWSLQYVPMFTMYHGSYGHTLETPSRDELGVDAHDLTFRGHPENTFRLLANAIYETAG